MKQDPKDTEEKSKCCGGKKIGADLTNTGIKYICAVCLKPFEAQEEKIDCIEVGGFGKCSDTFTCPKHYPPNGNFHSVSDKHVEELEIEIWQPVNNKKLEEVHYYFKGEYLGGLNPHKISKEGKEQIEATLKRELKIENGEECDCKEGTNPKGQCCPHCYAGDCAVELCKKPHCRCHPSSPLLQSWENEEREAWIDRFYVLARKMNLREETVSGIDEIGTIKNFISVELDKKDATIIHLKKIAEQETQKKEEVRQEEKNRIRTIIEGMRKEEIIDHGLQCERGERPCGVKDSKNKLADRCYIEKYDKRTLDALINVVLSANQSIT